MRERLFFISVGGILASFFISVSGQIIQIYPIYQVSSIIEIFWIAIMVLALFTDNKKQVGV